MFIRSERLFLRPAWPEDHDELLALLSDESVVRNLATVPWPYTDADARASLGRRADRLLPHFFITVPTAEGAKLIGSVGLGRDGGDVEMGYWIARSHWGQGYATEAVRAVLSLSRTLGHRRLVANHFADNPASARVLAKAGFRPTGRTELRYSAGRGGVAPARSCAVELGGVCPGDDAADMKAA
jgi:RimJ/RimL family protein N-acetyltransferase